MNRVTRTVVGLRPFRPSGYRLEAETIGQKTVIHSYGHGGCGVTMSWGTAATAADWASDVGDKDIAILGCGVQGLTAALVLARRGHNVTIYAKDLPPHTTSNIAGVLWWPTSYYDREATTEAFHAMDRLMIRRAFFGFLPYVNRPGYGVYWADHHQLMTRARESVGVLPGGNDIYPELRGTAENTLFDMPYQRRFRAMIIDPDYYLDAIMKDAQIAGAKIVQRSFDTKSDVLSLKQNVILNCTGLGAGVLFDDKELMPIRGQLTHLLPQPEIQYSYTGSLHGRGLYMFPRKTGLVLGGTFDRGETDLTPDSLEIKRMVEGHAELAARLEAI